MHIKSLHIIFAIVFIKRGWNIASPCVNTVKMLKVKVMRSAYRRFLSVLSDIFKSLSYALNNFTKITDSRWLKSSDQNRMLNLSDGLNNH